MRKLSNITESVWNDIRRRGIGTDVKKEDDVNLLDRDGLYDYLTSHYKNTNSFEPIYNSETFNTIKVPFLIQGGSDGVYLSFEENEVSIPYASPYKVKGLFSKLANEFSLKSDAKTEHTWYIISPKDGSEVTNTFFIYVIDFLLDNIPDSFERGVKKIVTESVWNDIRRRGNGTDVKKEDDVDILDAEGFLQYLKDHYDSKKIEFRTDSGKYYHCFLINILRLFANVSYLLIYNFRKKNIEFNSDLEKHYPDLFKKMNDAFRILGIDRTTYYIYDKDSLDVTNSLYIKVLNFIIDNVENKEDLLINRK